MENRIYKFGINYQIIIAIALLLTIAVFWGGIENLLHRWFIEENYSHGILIPLVTIYFIWQERFKLARLKFSPSWFSLVIVLISAVFLLIGEVTALFIVIHYALLAVIFAVTLAITGFRSAKLLIAPLILLAFAIPLPYFLEAGLSADLQLISSQTGVYILKLLNIPVFLEGNIIDLGTYKLQVVEACSGLRYLFPLMSFGFIAAYLYKVELWKRALVFLSTIPITIFMNSFRIAVVGILVDNFGIDMAEGFIHDFEGWIIFLACVAILLIEMQLLTKVGSNRKPLLQVFMPQPENKPVSQDIEIVERPVSKPLLVIMGLLAILFILVNVVDERDESIPERKELVLFPLHIGSWEGSQHSMSSGVIKALKLTDYINADYQIEVDYQGKKSSDMVNLYIAYYESQRKGASPHSPKVCVPGGGWELTQISRESMPYDDSGKKLKYNRVVIQKGEQKQLTYYWFQQRGRMIANEYFMKWYLFKDALMKNRTDGALVRLVTPIKQSEDIATADKRLKTFIKEAGPLLPEYIPD